VQRRPSGRDPPALAGYHGDVKRLAIQTLALCVAGAAVGLAANALSPRTAPLGTPVLPQAESTPGACAATGTTGGFAPVPRITVEQAQPLCAACSAAFVDARSEEQFTAGHVAGAVHLPPGDVPPRALEHLAKFPTVVVYDGDPSLAMAEAVAMGLREMGVKDVRVLTGAWPEWLGKGAPGSSGPCSICDEPRARAGR
jgi:rhodanese-related sulfurtransferase